MATTQSGKEQRQYFRIADDIQLDYKAIDEEEASLSKLTAPKLKTFTKMISQINAIEAESGKLMPKIEAEDTNLALYLRNLNSKINIIMNAMILVNDSAEFKPYKKVSISEGGLGLIIDEPLSVNKFFILQMVLDSSPKTLTAIAKVKASTASKEEDGYYKVRFEFTEISETDQNLIAKHVLAKQRENNRKQSGKTT